MKNKRNLEIKNKQRQRIINSSNGITLVALVITIIILLILAGVTINLTLGENGLLNRSESAKQKHEEEAAREKLEMALAEIYSYKHTDKNYNENEFIDNKLNSQGMVVFPDTNIVIVDNWLFEIDRSVPKIVNGLGKGNENKNIKIVVQNPIISSDYVTATIKANITFDGELSLISLKGNKIDIPTAENGVYNIEQAVRDNGTYTLMVKDKEGNYKFETIKVTELTEDMDIWNKQDMETFRDKVNSGRTFEGRKATVMANVDLECSETNQWTPIGDCASNENLKFKGTFNGQNYTISNIYINNTKTVQGLFGLNNGVIKNVKINGTIIADFCVGGITGVNDYIISNCHNNINIQAREAVAGIAGYGRSIDGKIEQCSNFGEISVSEVNVGGIKGTGKNSIKECYNAGYIHSDNSGAGGICGYHPTNAVYNCYNTGKVEAKNNAGGINGGAGQGGSNTAYTYNCYNVGVLVAPISNPITASKNIDGGTSQDINCYSTNATATLLNSGEYSDNVWIDSENGPILKWQK